MLVEIGSARAPRARLVPVAKSGGFRWITELDPGVASAYDHAVAALAPAIEAALAPGVAANRVAYADAVRGVLRLEAWRSAHRRFRSALARGSARAGSIGLADVRECYGSIGPEVCAVALRRLGAPRSAVDRLARLLRDLDAAGLPGLPVGPEPSGVLANAVLATADRSLVRAGFAHLRWVDDFVVFAPGAGAAWRAVAVLRFALADLGLELAEGKTRVIADPASIALAMPGFVPSARMPAATLRSDADALQGLARVHPLVPPGGGVDPGGRPTRPASRGG